jgi:hypothetical protein
MKRHLMKLRVPYRGAKTLSGIWTLTREYINASAKYWSGFRLKPGHDVEPQSHYFSARGCQMV